MSTLLFFVICFGLLAAVMLETVHEELAAIYERLLDRLHGHKVESDLRQQHEQRNMPHRTHVGSARHVHRPAQARHQGQPEARERVHAGANSRSWH